MKIVVTPRGFAKCGLDNVKIIKDAGFILEYNDTGNAYTKVVVNIFDQTGAVKAFRSGAAPYVRNTQEGFCVVNYLLTKLHF